MVYAGQRVALLTQHGKERLIAPLLDAALGCQVERVEGFDTDTLGSFTRDIPRAGTQIEAARKKARMGMTLSGLPLGLASEGSFGPDPLSGLLPWNVELLLFIDDLRGIEVLGLAQGGTRNDQRQVTNWAQAEAFARQAGFPEHHLVLRALAGSDARIHKGLADWAALQAAFAQAQAGPAAPVLIENDLRAHAHPTRQQQIRRATEELAARLQSCCPACGTPGFWQIDRVAGLPCADCGAPTRETRSEVYGCLKCSQRETRVRSDRSTADPSRCDHCNP